MTATVCDLNFLRRHGNDPVFALKWRVGGFGNDEVMPIKYGDSDGPHLFAVCFFLYRKDVAPGDEDYEWLCSVLREERDVLWYQRFGRHTGAPLEDEVLTIRYPTNGACTRGLFAFVQVLIICVQGQAIWHGD
jgi:hypothetical protein